MTDPDATLYFDFIDPLSYLVELELLSLDSDAADRVGRVGFELRPPSSALIANDDPVLLPRWTRARELAEARGIDLVPPRLVPWSRKAIELYLHAVEEQSSGAVQQAIFEAYFVQGKDIGRIDVLVEIAASVGMDATRTKAVLDVDRYSSRVSDTREAALQKGVREPPTILREAERLEGFHNRTALGTFLATERGVSRP